MRKLCLSKQENGKARDRGMLSPQIPSEVRTEITLYKLWVYRKWFSGSYEKPVMGKRLIVASEFRTLFMLFCFVPKHFKNIHDIRDMSTLILDFSILKDKKGVQAL